MTIFMPTFFNTLTDNDDGDGQRFVVQPRGTRNAENAKQLIDQSGIRREYILPYDRPYDDRDDNRCEDRRAKQSDAGQLAVQ